MAFDWTAWKKFFSLFILLQLYLLTGMWVFHYLEREHEVATSVDTIKFKEQILTNFTCMDHKSLEILIDMVAHAIDNGVNPANNATSPSKWDLPGAFFYAGMIITTIGYGHIYPHTSPGRIFTLIYTLVGVPIFAFFLNEFGNKLYKGKTWMQEKFNRRCKRRWYQLTFGGLLTMGIGLVTCLLIPSLIFTEIEGWSYFESVYYCVITLTTVGFGDFVAGQNADIQYPDIYRVLVFYWITVGLSQLAFIIKDISHVMSSEVDNVKLLRGFSKSSGGKNTEKDGDWHTNNVTKGSKDKEGHESGTKLVTSSV